MPDVTVQVTLLKCIQDHQELGGDEHMVSRVFCEFEVNGRRRSAHVDIKTVGAEYEASPIEIGLPSGYGGPLNYEQFRGEVEAY